MSDNTSIGWTDATWPVVTGCTHLSEGCDHCYAAKLTSGRLRHLPAYEGLADKGRFNGTVRLLPDRLAWPLHWRKPRRIFVSDMADLFHDGVPDDYIAKVFAVMSGAPQHTFQCLTKRHGRMRSLLLSAEFRELVARAAGNRFENGDLMYDQVAYGRWPLQNVWLGVSAETQRWADIRVPALMETPAAVRFVSAEPLLGPVDLERWLPVRRGEFCETHWSWLCGRSTSGGECQRERLSWVICGGESGPGHRPMAPAWAESIAAQCVAAGVPVFVKQASGPRAGQQGAISDDAWALKQFPGAPVPAAA